MGNRCRGTEDNNQKILQSSEALVDFVNKTITKFLQLQQFQQHHHELENLQNFVKSINLNQQSQVLENDHFISLKKIKSRQQSSQQQFLNELNELGQVNMDESSIILNQYNLCSLQFQDLFNSINSLEQYKVDSQVLQNKKNFLKNKEIVCEKQLFQMFIRISNKKFIIYQIIDYWVTTIKSTNLKLIIKLASIIITEIYSSLRESIIPQRIFEMLIIWMVQVIVFNLCNQSVVITNYQHLLDFIFYFKCPIEKMMILLFQYNILKMQYVIRDQDDIGDYLNSILQQYPRANLLKNEIELIQQYVDENWFFSLDHIVRIWSVIANRF